MKKQKRISAKPWSGACAREPARFSPANLREVAEVVRRARAQGTVLVPSGRGTSGRGNCAILDLSRLNRVGPVDAKSGAVTVEAGVSQVRLFSFLKKHRLPLLPPLNSVEPDVHLIDFSLGRVVCDTVPDFPSRVTSIEAILPDGQIFKPLLSELGGEETGRVYRWGVGPYLNALFSDAAIGIVTRVSFVLPPLPERIEGFSFRIASDSKLEETAALVGKFFKTYGGVTGVIKFTSPHSGRGSPEVWAGSGRLFGLKGLVNIAARGIFELLESHVSGFKFFNGKGEVRSLKSFSSRAQGALSGNLKKTFLVHVSVLPLRPGSLEAYLNLVQTTSSAHRIRTATSFTFWSYRFAWAETRISFDASTEAERSQAQACVEALRAAAQREGFALDRDSDSAGKLGEVLKSTLDPGALLSPAWASSNLKEEFALTRR